MATGKGIQCKNSMQEELPNASDQAANNENGRRQEAHAVPGTALRRVFDVARGIDLPADEEDDPEPGRYRWAEVVAEQIQAGNERNEQLHGILLDAKMPFKNIVSGDG